MSKICLIGYVPKYQKDYSELLWYERDMVYIDHLKYKQMKHDPDHYFRNVKVVNFDIINHECCGYKLDGTYKSYKMIKNEDFTNYPKDDAKILLSAAF